MNRERGFIIVRWLAAAGIGAWAAGQFFVGGPVRSEDEKLLAALHTVYGFVGLLGTAFLVAPELLHWAAGPIHRLIDVVMMPGVSRTAPADYTLARLHHQERRYEEACEEYLKIIQHHPDELAAYVEGTVAAGLAQKPELAARFQRPVRRAMRSEEIRQQLQRALDKTRAEQNIVPVATEPAERPVDPTQSSDENPAPPVKPSDR